MIILGAMNAIPPTHNSLIKVEDALNRILSKVTPVDSELVPLAESFGRVLAKPIVSEVNVPPFANSAMDGYAIVAADSTDAADQSPVRLKVIDNVPAGGTPSEKIISQTAARIMTGAPMPAGADAVIRFEETSEYISSDNVAEDEDRSNDHAEVKEE